MAVERHFLGWDTPLTDKVCDYLLQRRGSGPLDLEKTLLLVPTRQAGRRLREALAARCAENKSALLSADVITPGGLRHLDSHARRDASPSLVKAAWARALLECPAGKMKGLLPASPPARDFAWALHVGEMLHNLRRTLADAGHRIADVARLCGDTLPEPERWRDLERLESAYLAEMQRLGAADPCISDIHAADSPRLPDRLERIVIAAAPDPSPLALRAIERLSRRLKVEILVHADESLAKTFDAWGRPLAEYWQGRRFSVPDAEKNILLAASPMGQARRVLHEIATSPTGRGPADVAVGVPDRSVAPFVIRALEDHGLPAFDPAERPLREHQLYGLIERLSNVFADPAYSRVSGLIRHPDILSFLQEEHQCAPSRLLSELDKFQNACLPSGLADIVVRLEKNAEDYPHLAVAARFIAEFREALAGGNPDAVLRDFLARVYAARKIDTTRARDRDFERAAACLEEVLREQADEKLGSLGLENEDKLRIVVRRLSEQSYRPEPPRAALDIEGWLELAWNDAPLLIVTGMNDGAVPGGSLSDAFLPDSLRRRIGLPDDAGRFARDAYLMSELIESRRSGGRVCFIAGKTSAAGDPLKPSRLLFQCPDEDLPGLAARLFAPAPLEKTQHPSSISFKLDASACSPATPMPPAKLSVTAFRDYLACPFRFYLKHALRMEAVADDKSGLDAMDFGIMVHHVLEAMARDKHMRRCDDPSKLSAFFSRRAELWVKTNFGEEPSLPVLVSLDAARQRLAAAAQVQAGLVRAGWEIVDTEIVRELDLGGVRLRGKIDRIDRHAENGRLRVIDYKTSDTETSPRGAHLAAVRPNTPDYARVTAGGRERRWIDLQLPLYLHLMDERHVDSGCIEPAYFNLPRAVTHTGLSVWEEFSLELLDSAAACAAQIVELIRQGVFWPPEDRLSYDDFELLFQGAAADCFEKP